MFLTLGAGEVDWAGSFPAIYLRHENANKKVNNREIPILDLTDGEIDNFDELMDISVNRIVNKL